MKNQALWANSGVLSLSVAVSKKAATGGSLQGIENNSLYGCCLVAAFFVCQREELYRGEIHACQERGVSAHKLKNPTTREPSFYGNSGNKATASNHAGFSVALVIREVATMATHIFIYLCTCVPVAISKKRGNSVATKKLMKINLIAPVALLPRILRPRGWKHTGEGILFVMRTVAEYLSVLTTSPSWQAGLHLANHFPLVGRWLHRFTRALSPTPNAQREAHMTDQTPATPKATEQERHTMQIDNMRYFKAPEVVDLGVSEAKLEAQIERERAAYMVRRSKLESASSRLNKLRKTLAALNEQSKASDKAWRLDFVKGFGEQSKLVREQLKQKAQWSVEAEQTQEMIAMLEPQVEWLQMHTHTARKLLQKTVTLWCELSSHNALMNSLEELSTTDGIAALSAEVPTLFKRIKEDTYNDDLFMAGLGFDVSFKRGSAIASQLSREDTVQVNHTIRDRQYKALGELLVSVLPTVEKPVAPTAQLPELLNWEADSSEYPSTFGFTRRLKELEAQMEYVPNLNDLDAA